MIDISGLDNSSQFPPSGQGKRLDKMSLKFNKQIIFQ